MILMVKKSLFYLINKNFLLGNSSFRADDTLARSLKLKLKQRRDKIEQSESIDRIVL